MSTATDNEIKGRVTRATDARRADRRQARERGNLERTCGVAAIGVLLALASPAFAFDLCMTRTGHVRGAIAEFGGCRRGYHAVTLVTSDELPVTPPTTIPPPAASGYMRVVGADGLEGGAVLSANYFGFALAVRQIRGQSIALPLAPSGLVAPGFGYPYFTTPDCSGAPLVLDQAGSLVVFPPVVNGNAYVQNGTGVQQVARSYLVDTADCGEWGGTILGGACCVPQGTGATLAPATPMDATALGLALPLRIDVE